MYDPECGKTFREWSDEQVLQKINNRKLYTHREVVGWRKLAPGIFIVYTSGKNTNRFIFAWTETVGWKMIGGMLQYGYVSNNFKDEPEAELPEISQ